VTLSRCFAFSEHNPVWENAINGGDGAKSTPKALKHNPEAEPFFHATREVLLNWTKAHLNAVAARHGATAVDTEIAASLIFSLVGDAHKLYFDPATIETDRKRILAECIRFCTAGAGHPAIDKI